MLGEWIEYRGVRARIEIIDQEDIPEKYVDVRLFIEGDLVANTDTKGRAYGPAYSANIRATEAVE